MQDARMQGASDLLLCTICRVVFSSTVFNWPELLQVGPKMWTLGICEAGTVGGPAPILLASPNQLCCLFQICILSSHYGYTMC